MNRNTSKFPNIHTIRTRHFGSSLTAIPFGLFCGFLIALTAGASGNASENTPLGLYDIVGQRVENPEIGTVGFVHDAIADREGSITSLILVRGLGQSPNPISFHQIAFHEVELIVDAEGNRQLLTDQTHEMFETEPTFVYSVLPGEPATDVMTLSTTEQSLRAAMFQNVCTAGDDIIGTVSSISGHADGTNVNFEIDFESLDAKAKISASSLSWNRSTGCYIPNEDVPTRVG